MFTQASVLWCWESRQTNKYTMWAKFKISYY